MSRSFYDVLDVPTDAPEEAIRDAYREKVKDCHPDVSEAPDAEERFKRIKRAEDVLTDPEKRRRYDRLGHERYVDGAAGRPGVDAGATVRDVDDVRSAAARAAEADPRSSDDTDGERDGGSGRGDGDRSGGGRSAGWRERARRARGDPADWFENDVGYDATGPNDVGWTGRSGDTSGEASSGARSSGSHARTPGSAGSAARTASDAARAPGSGSATPSSGSATASNSRAARASSTAAASAGRTGTDADASRARRHAATDAWGNRDREARSHTHAVHGWRDAAAKRSWRPGLTQDEFVFLAASIPLYPILLAMTVFPPFPAVANVAIGVLTLAYVAFLLPRPALALPVFGTWSVGIPAILLAFEVPLVSLPGAIGLLGAWVPFVYSAAVAFVLLR